jgi:hypothetical protein
MEKHVKQRQKGDWKEGTEQSEAGRKLGSRDRNETGTEQGQKHDKLRQESGWNRGMEKHGTTEARRRLEQGHAEALNRQRKRGDWSRCRKNIGQAETGR